MSLFDTPGFSINTLKPVSIIRFLFTPSIFTSMEGMPLCNQTNRSRHDSIFGIGESRRAVFVHASSSFPEHFASHLVFRSFLSGGFRQANANASNARSGFSFPVSQRFFVLFFLVGHSLAKCPMPSHS